MKYFEKLYVNKPLEQEIGSPVLLFEIAIIKDTVDDQILLRNSFVNNSDQVIVAVEVSISLQDVFGETVLQDGHETFTYVYQDMVVESGELFGNKTAVILPTNARKAFVSITKVVLQDGTVWRSNPDNIVTIQPQKEITASDDYIKQLDQNDILPIFYYVENESCWQCTCGQINKTNQIVCGYCGREKDHVFSTFSQKNIEDGFNKYMSEKKLTIDEAVGNLSLSENLPEKQIEQKKNKNRTPLIAGLSIVVLVIIISMVMQSPKYNKTNDMSIADTDNVNSSSSASIVRDGIFVDVNEVCSIMENIVKEQNGDDLIVGKTEQGCQAFVAPNKTRCTYITVCIKGLKEIIPADKTERPFNIRFYDGRSSDISLDTAAYLVQAVMGDISHEQALEKLESWVKRNNIKDLGDSITIPVDGTLFSLKSVPEDKMNYVEIKDEFIDYADYASSMTPLVAIYENNPEAIKKITNFSSDENDKLIACYKKHEADNPSFNDLLKETGLDNVKPTEEKKTKTTKSEKTETESVDNPCSVCGKEGTHSILGLNNTYEWYCDEHWDEMDDAYKKITGSELGDSMYTCIECGKPAAHSITGLNNTLEWYCDEHWKEMQDAYNKITNGN